MGKQRSRSLGRVVWPSSSSGPLPRHLTKIGRNDRCPCGSGKKYKDCHQKEGDAFLVKLAKKEDKEQGVPWYKRLFFIH